MTVNTATVARLKASLERFERHQEEQAHEAARRWVDANADDAGPFVRLESYHEDHGWFVGCDERELYAVMFPDGGNYSDPALFWNEVLGEHRGDEQHTYFSVGVVDYLEELRKHM